MSDGVLQRRELLHGDPDGLPVTNLWFAESMANRGVLRSLRFAQGHDLARRLEPYCDRFWDDGRTGPAAGQTTRSDL